VSLRPLPADKVIKVLVRLGFKPVRQRGSHVILKREDGKVIVVPVHRGEEIGRGLLSKIIKDAGLTREEFLRLLEEV
jgi:predicted RNA binding protein YcfA (HicA-like mRNA interferase family)